MIKMAFDGFLGGIVLTLNTIKLPSFL